MSLDVPRKLVRTNSGAPPPIEGTDPDQHKWFNAGLKEVPADMQRLLEGYGHVPSEQIVEHVLGVVSLRYRLFAYDPLSARSHSR